LTKMNVNIIETTGDYCGASLYAPCPPENARMAPVHFAKEAADMFTPLSEEEIDRKLQEKCASFEPEKAVCYCVPCTKGIHRGGKHGIHLMEMILGLDR